jgi:hypothetical protein
LTRLGVMATFMHPHPVSDAAEFPSARGTPP